MAAVEEIAIRLGVKSGDLKAALLDAGASIKQFKKTGESGPNEGLVGTLKKQTQGLQQLRELLSSGVMAAAVKGFFNLAIDAANKSTDATDENARRVREFGRSLEDMRGVAGRVAVNVVGFFNGIGDKIGDLINLNRAFNTSGFDGVRQWRETRAAVEATAAAAEQAERRLADVRKKSGAEFLAITKELADIEKRLTDQKLKGLDVYETERNLLIKLSGLQQELANFNGDAIEKRRLQLEIARTQLAADEATLAVRKDQANVEKKIADERKKAAEEEQRAFAELSQRRSLDRQQELEMFTLQRKNRATLTDEERKRLAVLEAAAVQKVNEVEIDDLLTKKVRGELTPEEAKRLDVLIEQSRKLQEQVNRATALAETVSGDVLPAEQAVTVALSEQNRQRQIAADLAERELQIARSRVGVVRTVGDERNLNDQQLNDLIANLQRKVSTIRQQDQQVAGVGIPVGTYRSIEQIMLQGNLDKALQEQALRRDFQRTQAFFGEAGAQRAFSPQDYDRLSQLFNPDVQKQQAKDLSAIAGTLRNLFPEQYSGLR